MAKQVFRVNPKRVRTPVSIPTNQYFFGDSQFTGHGVGICVNSIAGFRALWSSFQGSAYNAAIPIRGQGGRNLLGHYTVMQTDLGTTGSPRTGPEWIHWTETGDQNEDGQRTATEYGDTVETVFRWLRLRSPNALLSCEAPYTFGRTGEAWRNWYPYRDELFRRVAKLAAEGINVHVIDAVPHVDRLVTLLGDPAQVWIMPPQSYPYHFTDLGNLFVGMCMWHSFGYEVETADYSAILAEGIIKQEHIDAMIEVLKTGDSPVGDGQVVYRKIPGAGTNVPPQSQMFLGGSTGYVAKGTPGQKFNTYMPARYSQPGNDGPYYSTERTLSGPVNLKNDRSVPYVGAYQFGIRFDTGAEQNIVVASYSYYFENPNNSATVAPDIGQLKQQRFVGSLVGGTGGIGDGDIANIYLTHGVNGNQVSINNSAGNTAINGSWDAGSYGDWHGQGEWLNVEVRVRRNSAPAVADGQILVVTRRVSTGEIISWRRASNRIFTPGDLFMRYLALQMWMGNGFDTACKLHIDRDVYYSWTTGSTVPKLLKLGNAATYAACTVLTVCKFTQWTSPDGHAYVKFEVNQGRHASTSGLYIYAMSDVDTVINTNGVPLNL